MSEGIKTQDAGQSELEALRDRVAELESERERHRQAKEALRGENSFRDAVIANAAEGLCVCHDVPDYPYVAFTVWNDRMTEITGYTMEQINRLGWYQTVYPDPDLQERAKERMARMRQGENLASEEWVITRADGAKRVLLVSTFVLETGEGEKHVLALMHDVTDRQQTDEELRESEERFRGVFDNAAHGITLADTTGRFVLANAKWAEMLGYTVAELVQKPVADFTPPEDRESSRKRNQALFDGLVGSFRAEKRYVRKDGSVFWADLSVSPLHDRRGGVDGAIGIIVDITDRKLAEKALRQSERDYRGLFENAHDAILIFRPDDEVVLEVNARACAIYGFSRAEFVGMSLVTISKHVSRGKEYVRELLATEVKHGFETVQYRKDGTEMFLEVNAAVVDYRGQRAILTINRDVTERKRAQEQLTEYRNHLEKLVEQRTRELDASREQLRRSERLASTGTLAAGIAHEINNPVGMVLLAAESAKTHLKQPGARHLVEECLDHIAVNAERCARITHSVLQFAKRETSERRRIDLNATVKHAVLLTRRYAQRHGGTIELRLGTELPPVHANTVEIEQVLVNLIQNAVEAAADDVRVVVRTEQAGDAVRLIVEDDGPGIAPEHLKHLFDPFFTTGKQPGGTGLGLSIVHGIITGHGGTVDVQSQPETGTVLTIILPTGVAPEAEAGDAQGIDRRR